MPDDLNRDEFYAPSSGESSRGAAPNDWDDDGDEYEVEPPDPELLAAEERRATEIIAASRNAIDFDEVYRDAERTPSTEILENWIRRFRFQFQVKHLLVATAVLAIFLTLSKLEILAPTLMLLFMVSVVGLFLYLQLQDRKHEQEAERRRRELYDRRRAEFESAAERSSAARDSSPAAPLPASISKSLSNETDQMWQESAQREKFRFTFSLWQLMLAMTCAALLFGMVSILSAPVAATLLGLFALLGLVVHALGLEPPGVVVLGWWCMLALYIVLSVVAVFWGGP